MVPVNTTSEFLLADARAALRRRVTDVGRTELSRAFASWLLGDAETDSGRVANRLTKILAETRKLRQG
jgi:hypothetical protein